MNNKNFRKTPITLLQGFLAAAALMTASMGPALAAPKVEIGVPGYGGSGCPGGSASVIVSPDAQEVSIIFDKYIAIANKTGERLKTCNLSIPMKVPSDYQVSIFSADFRVEGKGTLRSQVAFAGQVFSQKTSFGFGTENISHKLLPASWSRCGDSLNMRVNTSMVAEAKTGRGTATLERILFRLAMRKCK